MLFNSWGFVAVFLPIVLVVYHVLLARGLSRLAILALTVASLAFYATWHEPLLFLLLASIAGNYLLGRAIDAVPQARPRRAWLVLGIAINLALLFYFKYAMFAQSVAESLAGFGLGLEGILLPIGISFFTFQQIAYLADVEAGQAAERDPVRYALFVSFFPQLIAGPIVHHGEMMPQFDPRRRPALANLAVGLTVFCVGLAKKVVLADNLALVASPVFNAAAAGQVPDLVTAWAGVLAYALQIYFDFSGYSEMAIGLGWMFGIRLPVNFASPYRATSIIEFWRRWHITLSRFLRDYLYVPLGGGRVPPARRYLNVFVTMLLGGIWHGAGWTFVLWGAMHGALIVVNQVWRRNWRGPALPRTVGWALTFLAVLLAWVPFRSADMATVGRIYGALLGSGGLPGLSAGGFVAFLDSAAHELFGLGRQTQISAASALVALPLGLATVLLLPNLAAVMGRHFPGLHSPGYPPAAVPAALPWLDRLAWHPTLRWAIVLGIVAGATLLMLNDVSEFIYFQF